MRKLLIVGAKLAVLIIWCMACQAIAGHIAYTYATLPAAESSEYFVLYALLVGVLEVCLLALLASTLDLSRIKATILLFAFYHLTKHALMLIEVLFYLNLWNQPAALSFSQILGLEIMGLIANALLCPVVVVLFGRNKPMASKGSTIRATTLVYGAIIYTLCYLLAGAFILIPLAGDAYQSAYQNLQVPIWMPLLQVVRGLIWTALILCCLNVMRVELQGRWQQGAVIASCLSVFAAAQLLIPNAQMPSVLQSAHLVELVVSMSLFGVAVTFWHQCRSMSGL